MFLKSIIRDKISNEYKIELDNNQVVMAEPQMLFNFSEIQLAFLRNHGTLILCDQDKWFKILRDALNGEELEYELS